MTVGEANLRIWLAGIDRVIVQPHSPEGRVQAEANPVFYIADPGQAGLQVALAILGGA